MAGFMIHFAVGKMYAEKQGGITNFEDFYTGILAPDLAKDKFKSHYTHSIHREDLKDHLSKKVQLHEYLKENSLETDYDKGVFLHLVTDYIYFNHYFDEELIKNSTFYDFFQKMYKSYDCTNDFLIEKYGIKECPYSKVLIDEIENAKIVKKDFNVEEGENILNIDDLTTFIDYVSSIDLKKYATQIKANDKNIPPEM